MLGVQGHKGANGSRVQGCWEVQGYKGTRGQGDQGYCMVPKSCAVVDHTLRFRAPQDPTRHVTNSYIHPHQPIRF